MTAIVQYEVLKAIALVPIFTIWTIFVLAIGIRAKARASLAHKQWLQDMVTR